VKWEPKYLAAISSVYRTIPRCKNFEINCRDTIVKDRSADILHRVVPNTVRCGVSGDHPYREWGALADDISRSFDFDPRDWNNLAMEDEYWALDLCNYLGIRADGYYFREHLLELLKDKSMKEHVMTLIPYHQMFLKTNYEEGLVICNDLFRRLYLEKTSDDSVKPVHLRSMLKSDENNSLRCKIQAYTEFAESVWKLETRMLNFLRNCLEMGRAD